ncbi:MAG TPA: AMP-binding protein [Oscillatoriaceae cyanobacterium M33_DOE_052]|uniref:Long-chain fatty acid--CoA ligase n=1 Tax=Planktothricoides sp. SpSt-374 TaxID=2282167 RepID=A0A7C3VLV5_9CYAN|nr:AMP-binding protein [Oscillatoriaceae cyanobacterium M33_DOE_052]
MSQANPVSSNPFPVSDIERRALAAEPNYTDLTSLPEIWQRLATVVGDRLALWDPHSKPPVELTYKQLAGQIEQFAAGIQALGLPEVRDGIPPRVALFANDSLRWAIADQGTMAAGAANVVRSGDAERQELLYILENSGSIGLIAENLALMKQLRPRLDDLPVQWVILLSDEEIKEETTLPVPVLSYNQLMTKGAASQYQPISPTSDSLATLIYTSGTTGKPKGVMLTHANLLNQIHSIKAVIQPQPGERFLAILPTWHSFGRMGEYFFLSRGCTLIYTSIRTFKQDLKKYQPEYMMAVPRLWESIYEGVQKQFREMPAKRQRLVESFLSISQSYIEARRTWQGLRLQLEAPPGGERLVAGLKLAALWPIHKLGEMLVYKKVRQATGGKLKYVISGGGSLAMHLENFFEIVGLEVLVGYGLTETSPVLTARRFWRNLRGSAGQPIPETQIQIVNPETRQPLPYGETGLVLASGPQVMAGYFQNPEATAKAINPQGWFDTGDLGWMSVAGDLVLTGRAKDTIVLTNGENIEPQPIEDACLRSPYIDQIMLVGQDQKFLGALIVPNLEALQKFLDDQGASVQISAATKGQSIDLESKMVQDLFRQELNREVKNRPGYRADDRIGVFRLLTEPFSMENGMLTQTLKIKRPVVTERYQDLIEAMFV